MRMHTNLSMTGREPYHLTEGHPWRRDCTAWDCNPVRSDGFRIEYNGSEWAATFHSTVRHALSHILMDGPVPGMVVLRDDADREALSVVITGVDETWLYVEGRDPIDIENYLVGVEL